MSTTQRIYETHGTATVVIAVDYGTNPPTITRYDVVADVYKATNELAAADRHTAFARWRSRGYDARNGGLTAEHIQDLSRAADLAFATASKCWRVFRRRLAEANDAWSEMIRRDEADALAERNREVWNEERGRPGQR